MSVRLAEPELGAQFGELAARLRESDASHSHVAKTGVSLFVSGEEAFLVRALLIAGARQTIDLQYYLFGGDVSGSALAVAILQAADRGVRIRLLVDGLSWIGRDYQAAVINMHQNVEIRLFNPVAGHAAGPVARLLGFLANPRKANRRMHNKVFIVDDRWVILGGRNVGDRYFGVNEEMGFRDADVLLTGKVVSDICNSFDAYWNSAAAKTLQAVGIRNRSLAEFGRFRNRLMSMIKQRKYAEFERRLARTDLAEKLRCGSLEMAWADARLIVDQPDKNDGLNTGSSPLDQLLELAQSTRRELFLVSPYFIPGERGMAILAALRDRDMRVVLVTNSLASTDVVAVHAAYRKYRSRLLALGVEVYELGARPLGAMVERGFSGRRYSLHAKIYLVDRQKVVMGSLNLDPRSMVINTEIGVQFEQSVFSDDVLRNVSNLMLADCSYRVALTEHGEGVIWEETLGADRVRHRQEPHASLWRRWVVWCLGWLPIEDQL